MNNQSPQLLRKRQQGIGMIEVLVTLFILSVGLLGVAYLQLVGSFTNSEALSRSQSVLVAQQITERLRANAVFSPIGDGLVVHNDYFTPGIYNFTGLSCTSGLPHTCYCLSLPATIPDCNTNTCSAAEIAAFDGYEASCAAVAANPKIKIQVSCADNNLADIHACSVGSKLDVTITWPVQKWQDIQRTLNANCNVGKSSPHDCVSVELTL